MSWAKFDDRYDDNRKIKRAWRSHPRAVGLHAMAVTYSARHETDGLIDIEWLEDKLPSKVEREKCLVALLKAGLFERVDDEHFRIHDYLDYNDSRETLSGRREEQREKKRQAGRKGAEARWGAKSDSSPHGSGDGNRIAGAMADAGESMAPDPTRPDPTHTPNPTGNGHVATDLDEAKDRLKRQQAEQANREFGEWLADHAQVTGHSPPRDGTKALAALAASFAARRGEGYSLDDLKLASRGGHADDYRREHGYDNAESVLRPTKVHNLIELGRRADDDPGRPSFAEIAAAAERREREAEAQRQKASVS